MEIRKLNIEDAKQFSELIVDMYSHLENLEWFSPMPFDYQSVVGMIQHPRFYIIGIFEGDKLCGVSSLDYKCGKLIGKVDFPKECNTDKLVEVGFNMVHSSCRGRGYMKTMVEHILHKIKEQGFEWAFAKVHKDNFASSKSLIKNDFYIFSDYAKKVNINEFKSLAEQEFFSLQGKENAGKTLSKYTNGECEIIVDYNILMKRI